MAGALDGIKILDITNYIAGPFATMLLGDLGAEVYKIETPGAGDPFRTWDKEPKDYSPSFCGMNRNKKSVTLDMKSPEGKEIFLRLAKDADVIVENLRPGVVDRLGIGYEDIKKFNPQIIYCSISAFGQKGPYRHKPGYDTLGQSLSGLLSILTDLDKPEGPGASFSDHLGGFYGCLRRSRRDRGAAADRQGTESRNLSVGSDDQLHRLQYHPVSFQRRRAEEEQSIENRRRVCVGRRRRQAVCDSSVASAEILDRRDRGYRPARSANRPAHQGPPRARQAFRHDSRDSFARRRKRRRASIGSRRWKKKTCRARRSIISPKFSKTRR